MNDGGQAMSMAVDVQRWSAATTPRRESDRVSLEEPLEIRLSYVTQAGERLEQSISITMRTPGHDAELALGFLAGEAIIRSLEDVQTVEPCGPISPDKGLHNVVRVALTDGVRVDPAGLLRNFYVTSSCGVCGKASLDAIRLQLADGPRSDLRITRDALCALPEALFDVQVEFARTGGLHAAAAFDRFGAIDRVREDVGRHNAFDKLAGSYIGAGCPGPYGVLLSGRASFELVQKAAVAGIPFLAAIGPPSSLALELAEDQGMTLVGFLKRDGFNVYCGEQRIG